MKLTNTSLQGRLTLLVGVFLAGIVVFWITSLSTINKVKIGGKAFDGIVNNMDGIAELVPPSLNLVTTHINSYRTVDAPNDAALQQGLERFSKLTDQFESTYEKVLKNKEDDQEELFKLLDEEVKQPFEAYHRLLTSQFIPMLKSGQKEEARMLLANDLDELYKKQADSIEKLAKLWNEHNNGDEEAGLNSATRGTWTLVIFGLALMVGCSLLALTISRQIVGQVSGSIHQMSQMAAELSTVSQQMASNSEETATQAQTVSQAAETVSSSAQTVATSAEEMSASINEIAKNTQDASRVANEAVTTAKDTNDKVSKLGESSAQIGQVINVITSIAQQTDLLALNATIEAARAGEAGKGFAVVANEVKDLAKETSRATEDIRQKIETIQVDTKDAVTAIQRITQIITQINDIQSSIASAVEEQTAVTNEISRGASAAASGSKDIASNIGGVAQAAQETTSGVNITQTRANDLEQLSHQLGQLLGVVQTLTTAPISPASKSTLKTGSSSLKRLPRAA